MRSILLYPSTWKRLTYILALATAIFICLIAPVSSGNAIPPPQECEWNQGTIRTYYSDRSFQNPICSEVYSACPGYSPTSYCDGSQTLYYTQTCTSCS